MRKIKKKTLNLGYQFVKLNIKLMRLLHALMLVALFVFGGYAQNKSNDSKINYRYSMENNQLKVEKTYFNLGKVGNTETKTVKSAIYNTTDKPMTLTFRNTPKYITVKANPSTLPPNGKGEIIIDYEASANKNYKGKQNWGYQNSRVNMIVNGNKEKSRNYFTVRADIQEDFSKWTAEQLKNAPKAVFKEKVFNFGKVKQGETVVHEFAFTNEGQNDLEIRRVKGS